MKLQNRFLSVGTAALLMSLGLASEAQANHLGACGGIYLEVEAAASCEVVPTGSCDVKCEPTAGEKVCAARLSATCNGGCTASADLECVSTCTETCVPSCTTGSTSNPPNCMGLCMSDCQQDCNATCADAPNQGECRSSCAQVCSNGCHAQCDKNPEPVCEPVCDTACSGSCTGRANIDCQVSCQSDSYVGCKSEVVEECKSECTTTGAAIFCAGQFLATGGNLQACADDLEAQFGVTLDVTVSGNVDCEGNTCEGEGEAKATFSGCSVGAAGGSGGGPLGVSLLVMAAGIASRLRRRPARTA